MNRRTFLSAVAGAAMAAPLGASTRLPVRKGIIISMLPKELSLVDRLKLARDVGFEDLECHTVDDPKEAEAIKAAAERAGIHIRSVMNSAHWEFPLNSADPAVVKKGMDGMETSLRNAHLWGAEAVLLVPAVVNPKFSYYKDAWTRSQQQIRKLLPMAEQFKVIIAIEEVWNKFLLSPLEMARYIDQFQSPWVKAYMDVGNVVFYGYPEDWIRTLGPRIVKVHLKDFRYHDEKTEWTALREGDINWKAVYDAFAAIGYHGTMTVELPGGDEKYLREMSRRVDLILNRA